jgi:hypothetical protein
MKKKINIKKKDNITFGVLLFIFFFLVGFYPLKSGGVIKIWSVVFSLVFLIITIIRPKLLTFFNKLWIEFGMLLGKIISPIVMGIVFLFIVTPIGIIVRILKKDIMGLKKKTSSYWVDRNNKPESMRKQF